MIGKIKNKSSGDNKSLSKNRNPQAVQCEA
jgi:hypothetical protein